MANVVHTGPLILGNDPRNMSKDCLDIIGNEQIIALNQDPNVQRATLVHQWPDPQPFGPNTTWVPPQAPPPPEGTPTPPHGPAGTMNVSITLQVWAKPLANGDIGVVAFNRNTTETVVANVTWGMLGLKDGQLEAVRDLWLNETVVEQASSHYAAAVAPMDSLALRISVAAQ